MKKQHFQTTSTKKDTWDNIISEVNVEGFKSIIKKAGSSRIMFVIFIGSYQTGKSSKIEYLINGDDEGGKFKIEIGNGNKETTRGANLYGPVKYNELRKRFNFKEISGDDTCIFFVDTEGSGGFNSGETQEEITYNLSQFIAPYAALSHVVVTVSKANITNAEVESMERMLEIFRKIKETGNDKNQNIINVINDIYSKDDNYKQKTIEALATFRNDKSSEIYKSVTILPKFNNEIALNEQSDFYKKGFWYFAKELIDKLDSCKDNAFIDGEQACEVFEELAKITKDQDLGKIAKQIRENAKISADERYYKPVVDVFVEEAKNQIDNMFNDFQQKDDILSIPEFEEDKIISDFKSKMINEIPKIVQDGPVFKKLSDEGENKIYDEIQKCKNRILPWIKNNQKKSTQSQLESELQNIVSLLKEHIQMSENKDIPYITDEMVKQELQKQTKEKFDKLRLLDNVIDDAFKDMKQSIHLEAENLRKFVYQQKCPLLIESIIRESIEELKRRYKNEQTEIKDNDFSKFSNYVKNSIMEKIPKEIQNDCIFKEIRIENQIDKDLRVAFDNLKREINSIVHRNNSEILDKVKIKLNNIYNDKITNMNQTDSYDIKDILPNNFEFDIKKEINKEIEIMCKERGVSYETKEKLLSDASPNIDDCCKRLSSEAQILSLKRVNNKKQEKNNEQINQINQMFIKWREEDEKRRREEEERRRKEEEER